MSDAVKVVLSYKGIGDVLKGDGMRLLMDRQGSAIASAAGDGYGYRVRNTGQRMSASIFTTDAKSYNDNMENNTLLKSMR